MTRYRKKPVEVEAWQVGSDEPMPEWVEKCGLVPAFFQGDNAYYVKDGEHIVILSAFVFEQTYEVVEELDELEALVAQEYDSYYGVME